MKARLKALDAAHAVYEEHDEKYKAAWRHFSVATLLELAWAKSGRSKVAHDRGDSEEAQEECLDAINYLSFAYEKMTEENDVVQNS